MSQTNSLNRYPILSALLFLAGCATYAPQYDGSVQPSDLDDQTKVVSHTFYIAGGLGNDLDDSSTAVRQLLKEHLDAAPSASTLILTGDNITEDSRDWAQDQVFVDRQVDLVKNFKGHTLFVPGNNEWKSYKTSRVQDVEDYLKDLDLESVEQQPNNGCPIEHRVINDQLDLILVDSKWFISNWSRVQDMNKKCTDIVTRRRFAEELEGYINDGQNKNIVIAMHHPIFGNGEYAGKSSLATHMTPLPILGTIGHGIKQLGAFSPELMNSRRYNYFRILVSSLAQASDRITVVSGHEESLQYLIGENEKVRQIISGSLGSQAVTHRSGDRINTIGGSLRFEGIYTHGEKGFAKLEYFEDGSSRVTFITANDKPVMLPVLPAMEMESKMGDYPRVTEKRKTEAVLEDKDALEKSGFYKFLWGERYRDYFGEAVTAPVVMLDTLYGGLEVMKKGGGHQSYSIRLVDKDSKQYSMRSLRKNALKFLRFKVPGVAYTEDDYDDTFTEEVISDFFTTAHPFMQLVIDPLAEAVEVNHSSPTLYYVPKQERLGELNAEFGDELYFIEERPSDEQMNFRGYRRTMDEAGEVKDFESTTDMLEKIKSDESYFIDQQSFIRARVFDMLIGDWDRHQDQWRWVEYEKPDGDKEFLPVPRDRDNAFPKFDGTAMKLIKLFVPNARRWQTYGPEINNVKWLNVGGNQLDRAILNRYGREEWVAQARYIQEHLTEEDVQKAFGRLPNEVQDAAAAKIQSDLMERLKHLHTYAAAYSDYLDKTIALHGTEKDDLIQVERLSDGSTKVTLRRLLDNEVNELMFERVFDPERTDELWIYGLGDDDIFEVSGDGNAAILVRFIGGYGEDSYDIANAKKIRIYDWEHEKIEIKAEKPPTKLSDIYKKNTFHWRFFEENSNIFAPNLGFRLDDGVFLGATDTYTKRGFIGRDFSQQHRFGANYYFKFKAVELSYSGIFAEIIPNWNLELNGYYTSDRFSNNFFGFGNESINLEDDLGRDYYRARLRNIRFDAGIAFHTLRFKALYESIKVRTIEDRLFTPANLGTEVFGAQNYVGAETSALYDNADAKDFPSKSIVFGLTAGFKANTQLKDNKFGYLMFKAGFSHKLIPSGNLVFGTLGEIKTNFGNDYFFYHAPSLGGNNGLRGFRDERFAGKTYFYQSSDLRLRLKRIVTAVAPITVGLYGGFDYGRVWTPEEDSGKWHTSQGLGLWVSGVDFIAVQAGFFNSVEGNIVQVGFGFRF